MRKMHLSHYSDQKYPQIGFIGFPLLSEESTTSTYSLRIYIGWSHGFTTLILQIKKVAIRLVLKHNQTKSRITKLRMAVMIRCHVGKRNTANVDFS